MDLKQEMKSMAENSTASTSKQLKSCSGCHTTRTPLWRGGPDGPKSLCNACGIKYNKKRRELLGFERVKRKERGGKKNRKSDENGRSRRSSREMGRSFRLKLMALNGGGGEMTTMLRRSEEEQAALLLMALSCGSVYPIE